MYRSIWIFLLFWQTAPAAPVSFFSSFTKRLQAAKITTLEKALDELPTSQFAHFTMMRHSQSSQSGTPLSPRAITFGKDAQTIVAFNGGAPGQRGGNRLEFLEFGDAGRPAQLRFIDFEPGKNPYFSSSNETQCTKCHGADPHPIWSPYSEWPGAYGQWDDELSLLDETEYQQLRPTLAKHARFRHLPIDSQSKVSPYDPDLKGTLDHRPNFNLLLLLTRRHAQRLAQRIETGPNGQTLAGFLTNAWAGCQSLPTESLGAAYEWLGRQVLPLLGLPDDSWRYYSRPNLTAEAARHVGVSVSDWRMEADSDHATGAYALDDGTSSLGALVGNQLYRDRMNGHAALTAAYRTHAYFDRENTAEARLVDQLGGALDVDSGICTKLEAVYYAELKASGQWRAVVETQPSSIEGGGGGD